MSTTSSCASECVTRSSTLRRPLSFSRCARAAAGYPFEDGDEAPDEWGRSDLANIVFGLRTEEELFDNVDRFLCERDLFETAGTKAAAPFAEASADAADVIDADGTTSESAAPPLEVPEDPTLSEGKPYCSCISAPL